MILSRVKFSPQQRFDLEDYLAEQSAARTDSKLWTKSFLSDLNLIWNGFAVSGIGLTQATVAMSNAAFIFGQNSTDFSYFVSAPSDPDIVIPGSSFIASARNYVEAELQTQDGVPLTKAFWDPDANSGLGLEFSQIVNTITDIKVAFVVSTGGFSGSPDRLPISIIDTNGSGVIKVIIDRRTMYGRLAQPGNIDNSYAWGSKVEPVYALTMTSTSGTFVAGETVTIGTETATVVTGGTSSITFNVPSGVSFTTGQSVTGGTSGATGTVNTILESFSGVDKSLNNQKKINDAIQTELKILKNTRFWWQNAVGSIGGLSNFINSMIVPITSGAKVMWDGSLLSITDSSLSPTSADTIAKLRLFGSSQQLNLNRQDGTGSTAKLAVADGQVLFIELPASGNQTYTGGIGSGATNYQVANLASFVQSDQNYWIGYREGAKIFIRGTGELLPGESSDIGDQVPQSLLDILGLVDEVTPASYSSDIRGVANQSLVARIGVNTDALGDEQEDRSAYLRSDSIVTWTGSQLQFASDIVLDVVNTKTGTFTSHTILAANSPITINNLESVYFSISRTMTSENVTPIRSSITPIPAQNQTNKDIFVLARRKDVSSAAFLHLPFMKSLMSPGQSIRLGQAGSSGGIQKVTFHDPISTVLPTGTSVTIDGVAGSNGDLVLYSNLSSGNNEVYQLGGVGSSITWTPQSFFAGQLTPTTGDFVVVTSGVAFSNQVGEFNGTNWNFNNVVRYFNGADFWELTSLKTAGLMDGSTGNIFQVTAAGSENLVVDYSILRNGIKETGTIWVTQDGTNAFVSAGSSTSGDTGVTFSADITGGNLRLRYTTTAIGSAATMKFTVKRWSDSAGGPTGVPSYVAPGGTLFAAGSDTNLQFNSSGFLAGDNRFDVDLSDGSFNLNGRRDTVLSSGISVADNQASPANLFAYAKSFTAAVVEYSFVRNGFVRTGNLIIANDGTSVSINGTFVETAATGITITAILSGPNVQLQYTTTNTGFTGTLRFSIRKWAA